MSESDSATEYTGLMDAHVGHDEVAGAPEQPRAPRQAKKRRGPRPVPSTDGEASSSNVSESYRVCIRHVVITDVQYAYILYHTVHT